MDVLLVVENEEKIPYWSDILTMATRDFRQEVNIKRTNLTELFDLDLSKFEIAFLILESMESEKKPIFHYLNEYKILIICSLGINYAVKLDELIDLHVRGCIGFHSPIDSVKESIRIVQNGGVYMDI